MAIKATLKLQAFGRSLVSQAAGGFQTYALTKFRIGDGISFTPTDMETDARGTITFTGNGSLIQKRVVDNNTVRFILTVPEGEGPFNVGNIYLAATGEGDSTEGAFGSVVLPFQIVKEAAAVDSGTVYLPNPGNRLLIHISIANIVLSPEEINDSNIEVTVELVDPDYANLAIFDTELALPASSLNPWKQGIVTQSALTSGPVLYTVRDTDYWAMPFWRDIRHPEYNVLSGGHYGDGYRESDKTFVWGQRYTTPDNAFKATIGGSSYTDVSNTLPIIGGGSY